MRYKKLVALFAFCLCILIFCIINLQKEVLPTLETTCENKAYAIALNVTQDVINEYMTEYEYDDFMNLKYNSEGKLMTINANVTQMNKLSAQVVKEIQQRLLNINEETVEIPLGRLLNWGVFSAYGTRIKIKLIPVGNVIAEFKSEFISEGINQTKHTVYIEVESNVIVIAPFMSNTISSKTTLVIAETVIVGEIPQTYLGLKDNFIKSE